ncbi:conserved exported hypothetical protein [Vibrio crassostreae]|nr:hypothetical protein EDB50_11024 [Vibrio crassostreae]CAK2501835.1 conserved exported hypothetical protein [Vibrio crassostreae]CAK2608845.1 conserved exported hypothetical protein [Vibrio crassostreae]CAK2609712.1 conserved exported hypothetical protein [Vibrio crassostreae]CAK2611017.1 conserved exported hypothetical protein [Vibrio crassostreae]
MPCIVVMTKQEDYMKKALLLIALLASPTLASQLTEVFTDESDCSVKQVGYALKDNPVVFFGEHWRGKYFSGCNAFIPKKEFDKDFSICYLTGVSVKAIGSCRFGENTNDDGVKGYIFEFDDQGSTSCRFTCVKL